MVYKETTIPVLVAPIPPTPLTQPTTTIPPPPPVSIVPISTTPLPPPIFSQATTTTTPISTTTTEPPVNVNVSDTGDNTETKTPVTSKPLSPSPSTDSSPILGGDNFEFDSTYYGPYRLPTDKDEEAPVTKQQVQSLDDKLDRLLASSSKYNDIVLKPFLDTTFEQYTEAIDKSSKAVEASTYSCQKATTNVAELFYNS
ncbi:classical arabinogalactan protein 9-like [Lactuca sativa]|uniref:classical arabinogalactan protein 9-like n=1 Tax=Lactuca sativa TaxID=4236 RepID=UPI000CD8FE1F|nr:classical arabinogalactan protein 9-like [Lactuca sativa]